MFSTGSRLKAHFWSISRFLFSHLCTLSSLIFASSLLIFVVYDTRILVIYSLYQLEDFGIRNKNEKFISWHHPTMVFLVSEWYLALNNPLSNIFFFLLFFLFSEEELKSLLMNVKDESEKAGLKLNIQKTNVTASSPITSWQIDGEVMETVADFIFWVQNHCRWWLQPWN